MILHKNGNLSRIKFSPYKDIKAINELLEIDAKCYLVRKEEVARYSNLVIYLPKTLPLEFNLFDFNFLMLIENNYWKFNNPTGHIKEFPYISEFRSYRFKTENDNLLLYLINDWKSFPTYNQSFFLFQELDTHVSANLLLGFPYIGFSNGAYPIDSGLETLCKIEDKKYGIVFWNGSLPKEIYIDIIKDSNIYNVFMDGEFFNFKK